MPKIQLSSQPPRPLGKRGPKRRSVEEVVKDFWKLIKKTKGCWLWTGYRTHKGKGYGMFSASVLGKYPVYTHQFAWSLKTGKPVPKGKGVLHHCDNPGCVRFSHFFLGTQSDNSRDMVRKGRCKIGGRTKGTWSKGDTFKTRRHAQN